MKYLLTLALLICGYPVLAADDGQEVEQGKALYYEYGCYGCHGYNATMRVPLVGDASGIMSNEALFLNYLRLRADQNPINPKNAMPNYSVDTLSDDRARTIYAYLRSLKDDPPEVSEIAVMQAILDDAKRGEPAHDKQTPE
jgi:mono/diheme cytochrome c family protein